jgi:DNA-3-methyladenine glycosylase
VLVSRDFLARPATEVAPELLGCVLEHETAAGLVAVELTEVEAYAGQADPASHAYRGMTRRNAVMFGPPGHAYVYFTYGMHFCVNVVCSGEGSVSAVLLRAGAVIEGEDLARARRSSRRPGRARNQVTSPPVTSPPVTSPPVTSPPVTSPPAPPRQGPLAWRDLARGPARLCQALDIDRSLDGADLCVASSPLRLRPAQLAAATGRRTTDRSGTGLAQRDGPAETPRKIASGPRVGVSMAAEVPWRFWFAGDPTVSVYRPGGTGGGQPPVNRGDPGGSPPGGNTVTP